MAGFGGVPNLLVGCGHLMFLVTVVCHDLMARCFATLFLEIFFCKIKKWEWKSRKVDQICAKSIVSSCNENTCLCLFLLQVGKHLPSTHCVCTNSGKFCLPMYLLYGSAIHSRRFPMKVFFPLFTPLKFNSEFRLKNGGWKTSLSHWVSVTFRSELLNFQGVSIHGFMLIQRY